MSCTSFSCRARNARVSSARQRRQGKREGHKGGIGQHPDAAVEAARALVAPLALDHVIDARVPHTSLVRPAVQARLDDVQGIEHEGRCRRCRAGRHRLRQSV